MILTPSQTVGPYFAYGLSPEQYNYDFKSLVSNQLSGNEIEIVGQVLDANNQPIPDALIEIWEYETKSFARCGTGTDPDNKFRFITNKPQFKNDEAPFLTFIVLMRGQLIHSYTRMYFSDEAQKNDNDAVLNSVAASRRKTLIAQKENNCYIHNIKMQGTDETVFFEIV